MGVLDTHQFHKTDDPAIHFLFGQLGLMNQNRFCDLLANGDGRVQGGHGVLEHEGKQLTPKLSHIPVGVLCNIHTVCDDLTAFDFCRLRQQLHNGLTKHTFTATGFTDDGKHFTGV